jgi:hypothetical protein
MKGIISEETFAKIERLYEYFRSNFAVKGLNEKSTGIEIKKKASSRKLK